MRVALIMVKADSFSYKNRPFVMRKMPDSLTLGMLFAIIKSNFPDIEVEIFDETVETINLDSIQADLIGISVSRIMSSEVQYPNIAKVYPTLFDSQEIEQKRAEKRM